MKLGAEPKKVAILGGLLVVAAYSIYTNLLSTPDYGGGGAPAAAPAPVASPAAPPAAAPAGRTVPLPAEAGPVAPRAPGQAARRSRPVGDFRPSLKPARPEDRPDPMTIDPTLKLDLLAKLQTVKFEGGHRSLFDFAAEPPKAPEPKIIPKKEEEKKVARIYGPLEPPPPEPPKPTPTKPPPPPVPLKFYGFANPAQKTVGPKRAFFLEGDEIHVAAEGELVKKRYKVVRIGVNSVVVEDTEHKHQQTLPLEEQVGTGG